MDYIKVYIKQIATHGGGHIFEHIIANILERELMADGYLRLLDYYIWAYTDDGIVQIQIETQNNIILNKFEELIKLIEITIESVKTAVSQISCEYERLPKFDFDKLLKEIKNIDKIEWIEYDNYHHSAPINDLARTLKSETGEFGRKSPKSFSEYSIFYKIKKCPFELKPLAVYVILALSMNQINRLYEQVKECYDTSDEWAKYQDMIGYVHHIRIPSKSSLDITKLKEIELSNRQDILANDFIKKMLAYNKYQSCIENHFFSISDLYAYSYQYIGKTGWDKINTKENIKKVLDLLKITIKEKNN